MIKSCFSASVVCALCLHVDCSLQAKDLTDAATGCRITVPDNWVQLTPQASPGDYVTAVHARDQVKGIALLVEAESEIAGSRADYLKSSEDRLTDQGKTIISHEHQQIGAYDFYVVAYTEPNKVGVIKSSDWILFTNKKLVRIRLFSQWTDPLKDASLLAIIRSFKIVDR